MDTTRARAREIVHVILAHDPLGLVHMGAPDDEYDIEAVEIAEIEASGGLTTESLYGVFRKWFGAANPYRSPADPNLVSLYAAITVSQNA